MSNNRISYENLTILDEQIGQIIAASNGNDEQYDESCQNLYDTTMMIFNEHNEFANEIITNAILTITKTGNIKFIYNFFSHAAQSTSVSSQIGEMTATLFLMPMIVKTNGEPINLTASEIASILSLFRRKNVTEENDCIILNSAVYSETELVHDLGLQSKQLNNYLNLAAKPNSQLGLEICNAPAFTLEPQDHSNEFDGERYELRFFNGLIVSKEVITQKDWDYELLIQLPAELQKILNPKGTTNSKISAIEEVLPLTAYFSGHQDGIIALFGFEFSLFASSLMERLITLKYDPKNEEPIISVVVQLTPHYHNPSILDTNIIEVSITAIVLDSPVLEYHHTISYFECFDANSPKDVAITIREELDDLDDMLCKDLNLKLAISVKFIISDDAMRYLLLD